MRQRPSQFSGIDFVNYMDSVSMAMSEGDTWKRHRRAASRPLAETNLDKLVPMIIRLGEDMVGSGLFPPKVHAVVNRLVSSNSWLTRRG